MSFKAIFNDEIKRVPGVPESFVSMTEAIKRAFKDKLNSEFVAKYYDADGDLISVSTEEDYKVMLSVLKSQVKVFVSTSEQPNPPANMLKSSQLTQASEAKPVATEDDLINFDEMKSTRSTPAEEMRIHRENELRRAAQIKLEQKEARKKEIKSLKGEVLILKEKKNDVDLAMLKLKVAKLELKKTLRNKNLTEEEKAKLFDEKISNKAHKLVLKDERKEIQNQLRDLKHKLAHLKGKKPKCSRSEAVHWHVTCDGCGMSPLKGNRYKCAECPDFDFCEECHKTKEHPHKNFNLIEPRHRRSAQGEAVHFHIICDGCGVSPIKGNRYKCNECPDFDFCEQCHKTKEHPHKNFNLIERPRGFGGRFRGCTRNMESGPREGHCPRRFAAPDFSQFGGPGLMGIAEKLAPVLAPLGVDLFKIAQDFGLPLQKPETQATQQAPESKIGTEERATRLQAMFPHYTTAEIGGIINAHPMKSEAELVDLLLGTQ